MIKSCRHMTGPIRFCFKALPLSYASKKFHSLLLSGVRGSSTHLANTPINGCFCNIGWLHCYCRCAHCDFPFVRSGVFEVLHPSDSSSQVMWRGPVSLFSDSSFLNFPNRGTDVASFQMITNLPFSLGLQLILFLLFLFFILFFIQ